MQIKVKRLHSNAKLPSYAHPGDVGLDLYSMEASTLLPGEKKTFPVGFALEFPTGFGAFVKDKGSISQMGLHTVGGVFDAGYRGEYNVALVNVGTEPVSIEKGQKIAQLVILPVAVAELVETDILSATARADGRFGSTGKF